MLLDLSQLREVSIDPTSRTATLQPGVTSRELASALAEHELAFPVGHCGHVGLSGFLLSGGLGWNAGVWGPACLSITGVEVVTADGQLTWADEGRNAELFWAARGAGPGLCAVVTRFHLKLYPLPKAIVSSTYVYVRVAPGAEGVLPARRVEKAHVRVAAGAGRARERLRHERREVAVDVGELLDRVLEGERSTRARVGSHGQPQWWEGVQLIAWEPRLAGLRVAGAQLVVDAPAVAVPLRPLGRRPSMPHGAGHG